MSTRLFWLMKPCTKPAHISSTLGTAFSVCLGRNPAVAMATQAKSQEVFLPPICTLTGDSPSLNRDMFSKTVLVPAVRFNKKLTGQCLKALRPKAVPRKRMNLRNSPGDPDEKVLFLNPEVVSSGDPTSLGDEGLDFLRQNNLEDRFGDYRLDMEYSDWTCDEILRSLLPKGVEVPTAFSRIGHIAHLNLKPEHLKYKHIIGEVLMDKNPGVETVVNKTGEINNEFRFFSMELLAGQDNMVTTTKEHGHAFQFDFSKVYWNPRLSTEHTRIVGLLKEGETVYDMFAGVGPFAVPAAKKGCRVLANDLNPESFKWLCHNVKLNKIRPELLRTFNLDGREFVRDIVRKDLIASAVEANSDDGGRPRTHIVMNLPSLAIDFLDVFPSLLRDVPREARAGIPPPTVHCHCFSKEADAVGDVRQRIEAILNHRIEGALIHDVRDVAPNKEMMCASFQMPAAVLFGEGSTDSSDEPDAKRSRTE